MKYLEAPKHYYDAFYQGLDWDTSLRSLFIAGGITNCPN